MTMTMPDIQPAADGIDGGLDQLKPKPWRRVIGVAAVAAALLLGGWTLGHEVFPPTGTDPTSSMTDVDKACVQVLHNGGMPDDCSRMYHLMPIP